MLKGLVGLFANKEEKKEGVDFQGWQGMHRQIKGALAEYVAGAGYADLTSQGVGREDGTELGQWLRGEGRARYGKAAEFVELLEKQRQFHKTAAKIVELCETGERPQAARMLEIDLERDATRLIVALSKMEREANGL